MAAIVVLGVLALVAAIVAWVTWHRGADERQSVQHHQHALETLRQVADRHGPTPTPGPVTGSRRVGGTPPQSPTRAPGSPPRRGAPPVSFEAVEHNRAGFAPRGAGAPFRPDKESAKVEARRRETVAFNGAGRTRSRSSASAGQFRMGPKLPGATEQARRDGRARVRRARIVAAAAVFVIVAGGVGGGLTLGRSHAPSRPRTGATSAPSRPITAAGHGLTTTTVLDHGLVPTTPTAFSAHYSAPASAYTVAIQASSSCWVMATDPSSGHVVWTGTVAGGTSHTVPVTGGLAVELGAPSDATVTVNGLPIQLPTGFRSPFTLTFDPAA